MRFLRPLLIVMLGGGFCSGVCLGQLNTGQPTQANVRGKVVQVGSGVGIRKVIVSLNGTSGADRQDYTTATDAAGQFMFEGVTAGQYTVTWSRAGYVPVKKKAEDALIPVVAGQDVTGLMYEMQVAGVIAGKIMDADGDPVSGVFVSGRPAGKNGALHHGIGRTEDDTTGESTNDLGEYRIPNVREGLYIVQAEAHGMGPGPDPADKGKKKERVAYLLTYYPGTADEKLAATVRVTAGGTATANFALMTGREYRVNGVVTVPGRPRNWQILLFSADGRGEGQTLREGGEFSFEHVMPGSYGVQLLSVDSTEGEMAYPRILTIGSPIVVTTADLVGLQLQPEMGGTVSGKIRTEDETKLDWKELNMSLERVVESSPEGLQLPTPLIGPFGEGGDLMEDGSFEMKGVPGGNYQLLIGGHSDKYRDYYLKSVMLDGREVADTGFAVSGAVVLDVVVSAKGASIEGTVVDTEGQAVGGATVVSVPASGKLGRPDSYQTEHADANGHFLLRGMNPGDYVIVAVEGLEEYLRTQEFFQKYGERGEKVGLEEGEKKDITVMVIRDEEVTK